MAKSVTVALFFLLILFSCGHRMDAINWYLRIEHTEECGEFALYGGDYSILCPVDDAIWNGDSLVVKSAEVCYYVNAGNYKDGQPLEEFDCKIFATFISVGPVFWANGEGPPPEDGVRSIEF